jgi:hypothetical protein
MEVEYGQRQKLIRELSFTFHYQNKKGNENNHRGTEYTEVHREILRVLPAYRQAVVSPRLILIVAFTIDLK